MILCCGEALIDMIPEPTTSGGYGYVPHCGGAVYNTAIALGRLGVRTGMVTGLSSDLFGRQLAAGLLKSHVDTFYTITSARPTTMAFVQLKNGQASYQFYDENSAGRMLSVMDMPVLPEDVNALYFGGISLACEPAADSYQAFAQQNAATRTIVLDPNIRAGFITDETRYRHRLQTMIACCDVLKLSDEDLDWIDPSPVSTDTKVQNLLDAGPALVIITKGSEGAIGYLQSGQIVKASARSVQVVDTVGAGDTFNAGVIAKLSELGKLNKDKIAGLSPETLREALQFAAEVAAVTVSRAGANPPWANELVKETL